ncbi:MAG: hypothetical protein EPO09_02215 [Aquabacterium sp.]|uniref:hypothetical protein n=1 Tax=Aquabacterium sp. TaxID=1872578 RepID=UPI0011FBF7BF|nr:hypothetical protein [Aquabacterium sp.]TAK98580.1 MAG: hypothetical protein EPO09_02215 [Aquabacterium sp.]
MKRLVKDKALLSARGCECCACQTARDISALIGGQVSTTDGANRKEGLHKPPALEAVTQNGGA